MIVVLFYIVPLKELESQPMRRGRTLMFLQILCNQEKTLHTSYNLVFLSLNLGQSYQLAMSS